MGNKQLQYTYCPIYQEVKTITLKFDLLIDYNKRNFSQKIIPKMRWRNYSQNPFKKIKIVDISGSIV